jgi:hypothetical protein
VAEAIRTQLWVKKQLIPSVWNVWSSLPTRTLPTIASLSMMGLHRQPDSRSSAPQANEIPYQIATKARELTMAAHSDAVSLPEDDADELPETMVTPSLRAPTLLPQKTSEPLNSTCPTVHRGRRRGCVG